MQRFITAQCDRNNRLGNEPSITNVDTQPHHSKHDGLGSRKKIRARAERQRGMLRNGVFFTGSGYCTHGLIEAVAD